MKGLSINRFLPGIAWFFIVLVLTCLPGDNLPKVDNWFNKLYLDKLEYPQANKVRVKKGFLVIQECDLVKANIPLAVRKKLESY